MRFDNVEINETLGYIASYREALLDDIPDTIILTQ